MPIITCYLKRASKTKQADSQFPSFFLFSTIIQLCKLHNLSVKHIMLVLNIRKKGGGVIEANRVRGEDHTSRTDLKTEE